MAWICSWVQRLWTRRLIFSLTSAVIRDACSHDGTSPMCGSCMRAFGI
jgi:hypothetical protein